MPVVLGVDSSTQSTKVEARDLVSGALLASGRGSHPSTNPPVSEQWPIAWWDALVDAVAQLPADVRGEVVALSVAGQQHGLVVLDEHGEALRPAKLWNDTTSAAEAAALVERLGADGWAAACGSVPVAAFTITKLAWIAAHEPELVARIARIMLPHDYLTWRLCGEHVTDRGDASGSGWFDAATGMIRHDLLALAVPGVDFTSRLPRVLGPWEVAGRLTAEAAADLGLPAGVVVGPGTGDNMGAALGLGLGPGDVAFSLGTSGTVYAVTTQPTRDPSGAVAGFADATGAFLPLVCTMNATKVTDTIARLLGVDAAGFAALALAADPAGDGPVLVPYFDGERTPNRPDATGTLAGLTNATTRESLALAAHDGVLCGLLDGLDAIAQAVGSHASGRLFLVGGGARSTAYRQRLADLTGSDVVVPNDDETVAVGAAVQAAAIATGIDGAAVAAQWQLGAGITIKPREGIDPAHARERYRLQAG